MKPETFKLPEDIKIKDEHGFVYIVTNIKDKKAYVGMKSFWSRKKLPGKINKTKVESDWKTYRTSNSFLKKDIKNNPEDYIFEIVFVCKDEPALKYMEAKMIMALGALETETYYNENVRINLMCSLKDLGNRITKLEPQTKDI